MARNNVENINKNTRKEQLMQLADAKKQEFDAKNEMAFYLRDAFSKDTNKPFDEASYKLWLKTKSIDELLDIARGKYKDGGLVKKGYEIKDQTFDPALHAKKLAEIYSRLSSTEIDLVNFLLEKSLPNKEED